MKERIDTFIVAKNGIISRAKAQTLIRNGAVYCNGKKILKPGFWVSEDDIIEIKESHFIRYVSRGGLKLEKAISEFGLDFNGKIVLDVGASTGGFTDCALQHGASIVIAVDVGTGVMDKSLANDHRVKLYEKTDIRDFPKSKLHNVDFVVCDVSFISLKNVIIAIQDIKPEMNFVFLIKPQFECGMDVARRFKGVIRDRKIHVQVICDIIEYFKTMGLSLKGISYSPICGGDGNIEYITYFCKDENKITRIGQRDINDIVDNAFDTLLTV